MSLRIEYTATATVPVEVEGVVPNRLRQMSLDDIRRLEIFHGNEKIPLGEFFNVSGDPSDEHMDWDGDLSDVHWIGAKMESGTIQVHGNAGRHVGSELKGGTIQVDGDAGDWVGGEMHGGFIHVRGRAGHLIGAAYRGSRRGMTAGTIFIDGSVGNEIGHTMRRGLLVIGGAAGDLAGFNMLAGTILVLGSGGIRYGAGMRRGTIILCGEDPPQLLPSFRYGCRYHPGIMQILLRQIGRSSFDIPPELFAASFAVYHGDLIEGGRGEILVKSTSDSLLAD